MREIHQHLHQHQQPPQLQPVFEQRQQQKLITESLHSPFISHNNLQYNNYQQQIFQLQNPQTNHHEFFQYHQQSVQTHYFQPPLQQHYQEQQRRLQLEHQQQQSSCRQYNNFSDIITSGIPVALDLKPQPNLNENGYFRNDDDATTRCTSLAMPPHSWLNQADFTTRQKPYWKQFSTDISADGRNERGITDETDEDKDKEHHNHQPEINQNQDYGYDYDDGQETRKNRRIFGELEAICGHTSSSAIAKSNHVGSGSGLSHHHVERLVKSISLPPPVSDEFIINHLNAKTAEKEEEKKEEEMQPSSMVADGRDHDQNKKKKKRKRTRDEMGSMANLFERLVRQLMDHQQVLYKKIVEMIERIDKERKEREESWRRREMDQLESSAKSHNVALASTREASIVANLEKLTGQTIHLIPPLPAAARERSFNELSSNNAKTTGSCSNRWPKDEVEALIQIRSKLEQRFQEPGLKGPLWEEISNTMSSMGFQRNAKRCKEKWENINKYFKKSRENPQKDRRQKLKTCEYFDKLDQLYSNSRSSIINGCCYVSNDNDMNKQEDNPNNIRQGELKLFFRDFEGSCSLERFEEISAMKSDVVGLVDDDDDDDDAMQLNWRN